MASHLQASKRDSSGATTNPVEENSPRPLRSYENLMVLVLTIAGGVAALDAQAVFYLMPFIAKEFSLTDGQIGFIGSAVLIGWAVGGLAIARVSDRIGRRKPFLIGAFCCFAVLSGLSALATGFLSLVAARFLIGISEGPVIPVKQAIVIAESSPKRRGLNMGIVQNFGAQLLGTLIGPILFVAIGQIWGWRLAFFVAGIPGLAVVLLVWFLLREPGNPDCESAALAPAAPSTPSATSMVGLLRVRNIVLCMLIALCSVAWFFILLTFMPLHLIRVEQLSATSMSAVMSVIGLAGMASSILVPYLSDRFGRRVAISVFSAIGALAPLGVIYAGGNPWAIAVILFLGCQMLGTFPLVMATVPQESVAAASGASATGMVIAIAQIGGGTVGPIAAGWLAERVGSDSPLWLALAFALCAWALSPFIRETRPQRNEPGGFPVGAG